MLCLTLWFGLTKGLYTNLNSEHVQGGFKVGVVSKLSNKLLGQIHVNTTLCLMNMLNDMQRQASCLMRHATRFPRDVLFWVDDKELLPHNFAYKTKLEPHEEAHVKKRLEQAQQAGLLSMMWNEDDSWAERTCEDLQCEVYEEDSMARVWPYNSMTLPMELLYLEYKNVTKWNFSFNMRLSDAVKRLGFLKYTRCTTKVEITGYAPSGGLHRLMYEGKNLTNFLSSLT